MQEDGKKDLRWEDEDRKESQKSERTEDDKTIGQLQLMEALLTAKVVQDHFSTARSAPSSVAAAAADRKE